MIASKSPSGRVRRLSRLQNLVLALRIALKTRDTGVNPEVSECDLLVLHIGLIQSCNPAVHPAQKRLNHRRLPYAYNVPFYFQDGKRQHSRLPNHRVLRPRLTRPDLMAEKILQINEPSMPTLRHLVDRREILIDKINWLEIALHPRWR